MGQSDPKEEEKQLEKISASIKDKRGEVEVFDVHMKNALAELDKKRQELQDLTSKFNKETEEFALKKDDSDKDRMKLDGELEEIKMRRIALDKIAEGNDAKMIAAKEAETRDKLLLEEIERKSETVDNDNEDLKKELEGKIRQHDELIKLKGEEYLKSKDQLAALQQEREDIRENKIKHESVLKEVIEMKGDLAAQVNKNKDIEQQLKKVQVDLKNREQNCTNGEKELKDSNIELQAKWAKLNRKIEVMGFTQELEKIEAGV